MLNQTTTNAATLSKATTEPPHNATWDYRSIIGKLNYLEKSTRPDIAFASHQAARFQANPKHSHTKAVQWLIRYLHGTQDNGIIIQEERNKIQLFTQGLENDRHHEYSSASAGVIGEYISEIKSKM